MGSEVKKIRGGEPAAPFSLLFCLFFLPFPAKYWHALTASGAPGSRPPPPASIADVHAGIAALSVAAGATIPALAYFQQQLGLDTTMFAVSLMEMKDAAI